METSEAWTWAANAYPDNYGGINTIGDAVRHAYWTCLMTRYAGKKFARGLSRAHEVSADGGVADTVMDLHNNEIGVRIATNHGRHSEGDPNVPGSAFQCCRDAIQAAISDGRLWYMDSCYGRGVDTTRALLLPTNR